MIYVIHGVMQSGKSEKLFEIHGRERREKCVCLPAKVYAKTKKIEVYGGGTYDALNFSEEIKKNPDRVFFIDEAEFLSDEEAEIIIKNKEKVSFTVSGLDYDFLHRKFAVMEKLLNAAEDETTTIGKCGCCGRMGIRYHNCLVRNRKIVTEADDVFALEDGENKYRILCPECYEKEIKRV